MAKHLKIDDLTKGNIWTITESELNQMLIDGKKQDTWADNEAHYMNIIRPVFDIVYLDRSNSELVASLEADHFDVFSVPSEGENNAIAIRKHQIKKITDLTLENIAHLLPEEVLALIEGNLGTGWQGLPLAIQDIIESAFYVDCSVMPEYAMHRKGGMIDRRTADGYKVLELVRGSWIEAIFMKAKPKVEKVRFSSATDFDKESDEDEDIDDDMDDDDMDDDGEDVAPNDALDDDDDDEIMDEEEDPQLEDIEAIDESTIEDEE